MTISIVSDSQIIEDIIRQHLPNEKIITYPTCNKLLIGIDFTERNIVILSGDNPLTVEEVLFMESYAGLAIIIAMIEEQNIVQFDRVTMVKKPFDVQAFYNLIDALMWQTPKIYCVLEEVYFNPSKRLIMKPMVGGGVAEAHLTQKENELLHYLLLHDKVSKQILLMQVFGYKDSSSTHTLETHLYRLRSKISLDIDVFVYADGCYSIKRVPKHNQPPTTFVA